MDEVENVLGFVYGGIGSRLFYVFTDKQIMFVNSRLSIFVYVGPFLIGLSIPSFMSFALIGIAIALIGLTLTILLFLKYKNIKNELTTLSAEEIAKKSKQTIDYQDVQSYRLQKKGPSVLFRILKTSNDRLDLSFCLLYTSPSPRDRS